MPDSNGRFRGISVPALPWLDGGDDEEFAVRVGQVVEAAVVGPCGECAGHGRKASCSPLCEGAGS